MRRMAVLALVAVLATLFVPGTSSARPGDGPRPGYTIVNPPLPPISVDGELTTVRQGQLQGAGYIIETPPEWNGDLVMYAHGYRGPGYVLTVDPPPYGLRQHVLEAGYAWAASSYDANGYDVESGVRSTHALARAFRRWVGEPERVYLVGVSMGGHVTGRSIEEFPRFYDGALPMCGVLGDVELFDFFLDYNLVAQALADRPTYPIPTNYQSEVVPQLQADLGLVGVGPTSDPTNELGLQFRSFVIERTGGPRPGEEEAFGYWKDFLFTLAAPDDGGDLSRNPGRVATNLGTDYEPDEPEDIDSDVERVGPADPVARRAWRLGPVARIQGTTRVPVLSLHNLGDLFVPFSMEQEYARDVAIQGNGELLVQRAIRAVGHCEFSPLEATTAFDDLVTWVEAGVRPAGDVVTDRGLVASATYGCQFTDPNPPVVGTRLFYEPCGQR